MKVQNTTKENIDTGEFSFAPEQIIDVPEKIVEELVKVEGLDRVVKKEVRPKKAKK
jgi:hypothetical protein